MANLIALHSGTELVGDFRIERVLGAGGFGITYLADETALDRKVTIKEYFPSDFAARSEGKDAAPRSENCNGDYKWGLDRFIEEAQTLARFDHPNIVRVFRYFRANNTAYMVLQFEEGQSLKAWLKGLNRAPRQKELDAIVAPLLDALEKIHAADFLHRDIAPDNIIIRKDGSPVLIDFGSARGEIASHSKTVSALVKPGYSPYEQYAETSRQQGPWTDMYALAATLYHAITGKRPPDSPSRMVKDEYVSAKEAALSAYRVGFLRAIDRALTLSIEGRPQSIAAWRGDLLAPDPVKPGWLARTIPGRRAQAPEEAEAASNTAATVPLPPQPDAPGPQGGLLDFMDGLKKKPDKPAAPEAVAAASAFPPTIKGSAAASDAAVVPLPPRLPRLFQSKKDKVAALPAVPPPAKKPPRPRKLRAAGRSRLRPLMFKLLIGVGVASGAVALQDRLPRVENRGAGITTQSINGSTPKVDVVVATPVLLLKGHTGPVTSAAYADDGRTIVTSGKDAAVRIWNTSSGTLVRTIELDDGPANAIALSGSRVLTAHSNGHIVLWNSETADKIASFKRNDAEVWAVTFAGRADRFLAASHDWKVALWDTGTTTGPVNIIDAHENAVQALAFGVADRTPMFASGGADKTVKLWNLDTLDLVRTYRGSRDYVTAVAIAPDGKSVASASLDGSVRLWSTNSRRAKRSISSHRGAVASLAFSPAGDLLATAGADGRVRVWDFKNRRTPRTLPSHAGAVTTVTFSPDGARIVSGGDDGIVRVWENPAPRTAMN